MNIKKLNEILVVADNYISTNSLTLTFLVLLSGLLIILFVLFYLIKVNKNIRSQNRQINEHYKNNEKNNNIDRSMKCIDEFNSTDFRIKVLSVLEIKLKMHENNLGENQSIVNDAEFRYALINCIHFFNNTGYLYLNGYLENSIISNNLSSLSVELYKKLEPFFGQDVDKTVYWKQVNELFSSPGVLNLNEEVNPIGEKALF